MSALLPTARDAFASLDSGAQAITLRDLITGVHPRARFMHPLVVPITLVLYLTLKPVLAIICKRVGTNGRSKVFRTFALMHNIALCIYSYVTVTNVWPLTMRVFMDQGVDALYCTPALWNAGLSRWAFLFYASKIWELLDTFLVIWKQRKPSFLQVYHHAVTLAIAYMLQASHASATFLFVGLNAGVHTVMYGYYALTVVGVRLSLKPLITIMQIVQFLIGNSLAMPMFFLRDGRCAVPSQKLAVGACVAHAAFLIVLFAKFFRETYVDKKAKTV